MMIYTIQNEFLKLAVKSLGAEMTSLFHIPQHLEYLWQGNPVIWSGQAYNLFPIVCALANDQFSLKGQVYSLPKHGFARKMEFDLISQTSERLTFLLNDTQETMKMYPFHFQLYITYALRDNILTHHYKVQNTNSEEMYFSIGGHPAFNLAVFEGESIEDYRIEFEQEEKVSRLVDKRGFLKEHTLYMDNEKIIPIKPDTFNDDALVFGGLSSENVYIKNTRGNYKVRVGIKEFPYLGLWAKPAASYVCIEPWQGIPDAPEGYKDLSQKKGILMLSPMQTWEGQFSIEIG